MSTTLDGLLITRDVNGFTVLEVDQTSVDYRNCEALKTSITDFVAKGKTKLVFNLEKVSFMDSAGLGVVLHGKRNTEAQPLNPHYP